MHLNDAHTLSFAQDTFTVFYQKERYFTGNKVKVLKPLFNRVTDRIMTYLVACFKKSLETLSWGTGSTVESIGETKIQLPVKCGQIDFEFMENFVAELESRRVAELESYLLATGLKDYVLTAEEEKALSIYKSGNIDFKGYEFEDIFDKIKQGRRLKKDDQLAGKIPFVMAGVTNTGVANYISNPIANAKFPGNSITIDIFGNTFYRNYAFGAGDDTGVYWSETINYEKECMLYFATTMAKAIKGKFSYGKKLRSSQSLKFKMLLPVRKGKIDFEFMKNYISAIQKLVIKDVVLYADSKIEATKSIVKTSK